MNELRPSLRERRQAVRMAASCHVMLNDIEVMADIGALTSEQGIPQPLRIHVAANVVPPREDRLSQTFDYSIIRAFALKLAAERIVLIETFAQRLARMCLTSDAVLDVEVRIEKPRAIPDCLAGVCVKLGKPGNDIRGTMRRA